MRLERKRGFGLVFCTLLFMLSLGGAVSAEAQAPGDCPIGCAPSQQEIIARYQALEIDLVEDRTVSFTSAPVLSKPYSAGQVAPDELEEALNVLNFMRFVAGVPDDITLKPEYVTMAQHASALMAANGVLAHTQTRGADMPGGFYALGAQGTQECNLGRGYGNTTDSLLNYMQDTDHVNIFKMGHRRWLLNPAMESTGFGFANGYSATYAFDRGRPNASSFDYIAWPAANTPIELYTPRKENYAFTVVLGPAYAPAKLDGLTVSLSDGAQSWKLTSADYSLESFNTTKRFLGVNTEPYGPANCIIFSVGAFQAGDQVDIVITGLSKDGGDAALSYSVRFFSLEDKP